MHPVAPLSPALTRRRLLQAGAAAGVAALLGGPAAARAAGGQVPAYLRRSPYLPLVGQRFDVGGHDLVLTAVDDLAGAAENAALQAADDAFALSFEGPAGVFESGIQPFGHPAIGRNGLFVTPVGRAGGERQLYEVVVDRSIKLPDPPEPGAPRPGAAAAPTADEHEAARAALTEATEATEATPGNAVATVAAGAVSRRRTAIRRKRRTKRRRTAHRAAIRRKKVTRRRAGTAPRRATARRRAARP
jgi:hypothetical protein